MNVRHDTETETDKHEAETDKHEAETDKLINMMLRLTNMTPPKQDSTGTELTAPTVDTKNSKQKI